MKINNIFKKIYSISNILFFVCALSLPLAVFGAADPAAKTGITYECVSGSVYGNCDWNDLIAAVKKVTDFGAKFTLMFSVVVIAFAGFKYMISGEVPGERKKANDMLFKVVQGIFFILAAWLIVTLITNSLLKPDVLKIVPLK